MSDLRTPLRRARGLGSAKDGVNHFIAQRATAIALIPLIIWFLVSVVAIFVQGDLAVATAYLAHPFVSILMILLIIAAFHHMRLGLQVVIEDYIETDGSRIALLLLVNFLAYGFGAAAVFAILKISFTG